MNIDEKSTLEILECINNEDEKVAAAVRQSLPEIEGFVNALVAQFHKGGSLFYVGSGTSGRLGVLDAAECPPTFSTSPELVQGIIAGGYDALVRSIEAAEDDPKGGTIAIVEHKVTESDAVLGITASSSTLFVLGALEQAKKLGAVTGLLICNQPPELDYVDHFISIIVGPEVITGSTRMKAGTATKIALNMITTTAMIKLNKTYGNLMVDLKASNAKLWDRGARIISHLTDLNYEDSMKLLKAAGGEVKTALVMEKLRLSAAKARAALKKEKGSLRKLA